MFCILCWYWVFKTQCMFYTCRISQFKLITFQALSSYMGQWLSTGPLGPTCFFIYRSIGWCVCVCAVMREKERKRERYGMVDQLRGLCCQ